MGSNLTQRILTGAVAGVISLTFTVYSPLTFIVLLTVVTAISAHEWLRFADHTYPRSIVTRYAFTAAFIPYFLPSIGCLMWLRYIPKEGIYLVLALFALVWTTDIAAYACGRLIGGAKIAPRISPNKTWAGLIGAMIATACMAAWLASLIAPNMSLRASLYGALLTIVAQAGDFLESWLKRRAGLKDSGNVLPGHGGMLDRIDGIVTAAPLYTLIIYMQVLK